MIDIGYDSYNSVMLLQTLFIILMLYFLQAFCIILLYYINKATKNKLGLQAFIQR